jgi:hypothetical protein
MGSRRLRRQISGRVPCALVCALGLLACVRSTPRESIAGLTAQARANEMRAVADYQGEQLRVAAVITSTGLKKVERLVSKGLAIGYMAEWSTAKKTTTYPYITARDPSRPQGGGGELLCFFSPSDMSEIAELSPGAQVIVSGQFQEFTEGGAKLVLHSCELE